MFYVFKIIIILIEIGSASGSVFTPSMLYLTKITTNAKKQIYSQTKRSVQLKHTKKVFVLLIKKNTIACLLF